MNSDFVSTRLSFRRLDPSKDDFRDYLSWLRDTENNQFINSADKDFKLSDLKYFVNQKNESDTAILLGIFLLKKPKLIGTIKLEPIDHSSKSTWLGMLIGDVPSRGQGYGFEALSAVLEYAFNVLMLKKVFLGVDKMNSAARHLYLKIGFRVSEENDSSFTMTIDSNEFKLE